jgi:hypothetical protein
LDQQDLAAGAVGFIALVGVSLAGKVAAGLATAVIGAIVGPGTMTIAPLERGPVFG